ncbi:MAG: MFS transporter [Bacteroidales bacterium]|nr:MFS transporter [Bacteroidales bacterium]
MSNWRWWLCSLLFVATTVNYLDRQVLSLTYEEFIKPEFHWTDADYGKITGLFSIFYAIACLFAGKFVDWMGTKKGYLIAIGVWSGGACLHALCGWATTFFVDDIDSVAALRAVEAGSQAATAIATTSVWLFLLCRGILALGEAGNFPAAIKVTAEYFPKKDRAFATSLFNAGASVGALAAPLCIPPLAKNFGWEMAFIIIGALGFVWMFFWQFMYDKPEESKHVNEAELEYIHQDDVNEGTEKKASSNEAAPVKMLPYAWIYFILGIVAIVAAIRGGDAPIKSPWLYVGVLLLNVPFYRYYKYRQTWSFVVGKFFTDGVWWFFLFWAPSYFQNQFGYKASDGMGQALIFTLYAIVTIISIGGGYLPKLFVEKKGMEPYAGRMLSMLLFAFFPIAALFAQPLGASTAWWPAILIGIAGAGHQAWSANLFSTIGDMFPKSMIATITGIGAMAGGIGSMLIQMGAGNLFKYAEEQGAAFTFLGFDGKPAGYFIMFCFCGIAYLTAWIIMKSLVPKYKKVEV